MKLCSACLLGINCRRDGKNNRNKKVLKLLEKEILVPICPEILGGLATPRVAARLTGNALKVLRGKAKVLTKKGKDVSNEFIKGAKESLKIAKIFGIKEAVLKQGSPSCGCGRTIFCKPSSPAIKEVKKGDGITTALLKMNGIKVVSEENL